MTHGSRTMLLGAGMELGSKQQAPAAATSAGVSPVQEGMGNPGQKLLRNRLCNASVSKSFADKNRDTWGQIHQVLDLHIHIQTFPGFRRSSAFPARSQHLCLQPGLWAIHGAGKYLVKTVQIA